MEETKQNYMHREVWSLDDVCLFLGVKKGWVYGAVHRREIPHVKMGLYLKFQQSKIVPWFEGLSRNTAA